MGGVVGADLGATVKIVGEDDFTVVMVSSCRGYDRE
jgi:hypothetical protein